jgi:hypothetical protein
LQTCAVVSHTAVLPVHAAVSPARHWTQAPAPPFPAVLQTGVPPEQPRSSAVQFTQAPTPPAAVRSQNWGAVQPAVALQWTHWPSPPLREVSQNAGVVHPVLSARQVSQVWSVVLQYGVAPLQLVLPRHSTHAWFVTSQTDPAAQPLLSARQVLHCPLAVSQTSVSWQVIVGAVPPQFAATHWFSKQTLPDVA